MYYVFLYDNFQLECLNYGDMLSNHFVMVTYYYMMLHTLIIQKDFNSLENDFNSLSTPTWKLYSETLQLSRHQLRCYLDNQLSGINFSD